MGNCRKGVMPAKPPVSMAYYAPAYTEPMDSIFLLATDETSALPDRFRGYPDTPWVVQAEMAKALHPRVHLHNRITYICALTVLQTLVTR